MKVREESAVTERVKVLDERQETQAFSQVKQKSTEHV